MDDHPNASIEEGAQTAAGLPPDPAALAAAALAKLDALASDLARLAEVADMTARQVAFIPPQVRALTGKLDSAVSAIAESRYQALLLRLLGLYDLALQLLPPESDPEGRHRFDVLLIQLRQVLEVNGITEIPTTGACDPNLHRSLGRVAVSDPALDGKIAEVMRAGFRAGTGVLRYAEVRVWAYTPREEGTGSEA
jgi:molecular chaperone GrpE (heat shock protein)